MIETERLILRGWRDGDRVAWHTIVSDPRVMATIGPFQTRGESDAFVDRMIAAEADRGWFLWAVERRSDAAMIGFCGLNPGPDATPVAGAIEIGWRLAAGEWGKGYAREAAEAVLDWAWANLPDDRIAAITSVGNVRSWGLMERLDMVRDPGADFAHPRVPADSALKPHITYWIDRPTSRRATP